jgi:hypothetical protein
MNPTRLFLGLVIFFVASATSTTAQTGRLPAPVTAPPNMLLLVHQEFQSGKAGERQKLEVASARAYDSLNVPLSWIDLQAMTGRPEALFFDPLDSFEELDQDFAIFGQLFASHPDLARLQEEIEALVLSERTIIAVRRDDLGYRATTIDLSKARFLRVLEVRLHPGHESDFVEAFKILSAAYERIDSDTPWVVYQVNVGAPSPTFLALVPMNALRQNDDLLARARPLREAEGQDGFQRMQQIAQQAYTSTESNLYLISPEMSHVSKEFAAGDPSFWAPKSPASSVSSQPKPSPAQAPKQRQ